MHLHSCLELTAILKLNKDCLQVYNYTLLQIHIYLHKGYVYVLIHTLKSLFDQPD